MGGETIAYERDHAAVSKAENSRPRHDRITASVYCRKGTRVKERLRVIYIFSRQLADADGGFQRLIDNLLDAVIGNLSSANIRLDHKGHRFALHDSLFAKSLDALKPGRVMALVTSHFTLDRQHAAIREYLAERADFVGAIRLPARSQTGRPLNCRSAQDRSSFRQIRTCFGSRRREHEKFMAELEREDVK